MDYKKIIKSRDLRQKILKLLRFIPDRPMLKIQYWIKTGRRLNLKDPKRYTEKLQWLKLYYKTRLMVQCVDKGDVRDFISSIGLQSILTNCYGIYESAGDIDYTKLPSQFVLKDTLGGGGNSVIIVQNKNDLNIQEINTTLQSWLNTKVVKDGGREWPYYSGKNHRIIIEEYIDADINQGGLIDYKFLCFNGKIELLYVMADREVGKGAGCGIFTKDFQKMCVTEDDELPLQREIKKPKNYDSMLLYVEKIAAFFPEARIDMYNEDGRIVFGEITFFDSSGYMCFDPDSFDLELGKKLMLPPKRISLQE